MDDLRLHGLFGGGSFIKSVQRGISTIDAGKQSMNVNISTVDLSKTIVLVDVNVTVDGESNYTTRAYLVSNSSLSLYRFGTSGKLTISWQVVEFKGNVKVQTGHLNSNGEAIKTVNIAPIDMSKSFLIFNYSAATNPSPAVAVLGSIVNNSQIRFEAAAVPNYGLYWQVVEIL